MFTRRPKGAMKPTAATRKDDANAGKQHAQKLDLLARMRQRIADKPTGG